VPHSHCTSKKSPAFRPTLRTIRSFTFFLPCSCDNVFSLSHRYYDSPGPKTSRWWKILVPSCVYCLNCTKFGPLILRKIIKIVATRHQIRFRLGLRPRPRWGAYSAPPDPLPGFKGPISKEREERDRGEGEGKEDEGRWEWREGGRKERGGRGRDVAPQTSRPNSAHALSRRQSVQCAGLEKRNDFCCFVSFNSDITATSRQHVWLSSDLYRIWCFRRRISSWDVYRIVNRKWTQCGGSRHVVLVFLVIFRLRNILLRRIWFADKKKLLPKIWLVRIFFLWNLKFTVSLMAHFNWCPNSHFCR